MGCLDSNLVWYNRFFTAYGNILLQGFIINFPMIQARKISNHFIHSTIPMEFIHVYPSWNHECRSFSGCPMGFPHFTEVIKHIPSTGTVSAVSWTSRQALRCTTSADRFPRWTSSPVNLPNGSRTDPKIRGVPRWNDRFYTDWSSETGDLTIENADLTRSDLEKPAGRQSNPQLICCYKWI